MMAGRGDAPASGQVHLDHVGHFVADAAACARTLAAAGFTVTPFSAQMAPDPATGQPGLTGTGNVCVMLRRGYLEFLVHTADTPIGLEFREALARRAGLHLAAFGVADADAAHAALTEAGWPMRPIVRMARDIATESGAEQARFTVARLRKGVMPEGRIQFLTHHNAPALWQARWLAHPNGATGLGGIVLSAPDPAEVAARFARVLDRPTFRIGPGRVRIRLERGTIEIMAETAAAEVIGMTVAPGRPAIVGYLLEVADRAGALRCFERAGLPVRACGSGAVVTFPPELGRGAWFLGTGA